MTLSYDDLNRLIGRSYAATADNVTFAYDLLSRRTVANYSNGTHSISFAYDNAGRLTSTTSAGKTLSYQYDPAGNRTRITWPEATAFYVTTDYVRPEHQAGSICCWKSNFYVVEKHFS